MQSFADRLYRAVSRHRTPLCVGIDPRWDQIPAPLKSQNAQDFSSRAFDVLVYCQHVIDVVAPLVPAVKVQIAFFEQLGPLASLVLARTLHYAHEKDLVVVLDAKRGDIGSTADAYARAYLAGRNSPLAADALTVNPYLGRDSLEPFVQVAQAHGTGLFVLVKTSNPGSADFQDGLIQDRPLYRHVGAMVEQIASQTQGEHGYGLAGAVVGATHPEQLAELRAELPHAWLLVPGLGAQGGRAADVAGAFDTTGHGALVNSARDIIFAYQRPEYQQLGDWQRAIEQAAHDTIEQLRDATPAGRL